MRAIFISYRRNDTEGQAGRLFDDLTHHFGDDAVFMDVAAIEPGRDFRRAIDQQVASCGVLLAIIGKDWVSASDESGARRLDDPMDFVRLETASALKRDIPVVPVLVQGARMPRAEDLPEDLKELAFRNAVELTHARWDSDVQVLVKALRPHVQGEKPPRPEPGQRDSKAVIPSRTIIVGVILGALVLAFGWYAWQRPPLRDQGATLKNATPPPTQASAVTVPGVTTQGKATPSSRRVSLVGNWSGAPDCQVVFWKDDGKNVEGSCNTGVRHNITGVHIAKYRKRITITRIDQNGCETSVGGSIAIKSDDVIEMSQDGWNGCGVETQPATTLLKRS